MSDPYRLWLLAFQLKEIYSFPEVAKKLLHGFDPSLRVMGVNLEQWAWQRELHKQRLRKFSEYVPTKVSSSVIEREISQSLSQRILLLGLLSPTF